MILFMSIDEEIETNANWEPVKQPKEKEQEKEQEQEIDLSVYKAFELMHKQDGTEEGKRCDSSSY